MKSLFLCLLLLPLSSWAGQPELKLDNVNFLYNKPSGLGTAVSVGYQGILLSGDLQLEVSKGFQANQYLFEFAGIRIPYTDQIGTFEKVIKGEMKALNALYQDNQLSISFKHFNGIERRGQLTMSDFQLTCFQRLSLLESEVIDLLDSCLKQGSLKLGTLKSVSANKPSISSFAGDLTEHINSEGSDSGNTVKDVSIKIRDHKIHFSLKLPTPVWNMPAEGQGEIHLDRATNELVIKVRKVKAGGLLTVTSAFFKAIAGVGDGRLKVNQPYLRIKLSN
ncbi:hypothetical protein EOPP23_00655 [Endozoicomonas sp. OPT23]|uniref:hypothetical protein n=1 Tax=Endozoicomonas sp. OPT23 TaxID=2072845 RepID=UPI00129AC808|nr:hypothetical protein [Endozoicomonas sp. OPT23]MRI31500.1 hypothetical protein [Endozoicomonas sp. OPT23]